MMTIRLLTQRGLILKTDGTTQIIELPRSNQLEIMQGVVGGMIECVTLQKMGYDFYINEEGKILNLTYNRVATALWEQNYDYIINDFLVGDVLIVSNRTTSDGNLMGLSTEQIEELQLKIPPLFEALSDVPHLKTFGL